MVKGYKYQIYPNKEQETLFQKTFGCVRFIYNKLLEERIKVYAELKDDKEKLYAYKYHGYAFFKEEFEWLKEVDCMGLQNAQDNLNSAYKNFFKHAKGFPKFKAKHFAKKIYTTSNCNLKRNNTSIRLTDNTHIRLPKLGDVKIKLSRPLPKNAVIKSATISQAPSGKYFVSVLVEYFKFIPKIVLKKETKFDRILGLDYSSPSLYTDSQGIKAIEFEKFFKASQEKLAKEQRKLSRMEKGSNNYREQRIKVARVHEHIANQRKDFLHKDSTRLAKQYDCIVIETLNMKAMSQCLNLGKSTMDNGWGYFTTFLKYKLEDRGKQLVKIDKWFPSSKKCRFCGSVNKDLKLGEMEWVCPNCNFTIDRNLNAAKNIRNEGLRMLGLL